MRILVTSTAGLGHLLPVLTMAAAATLPAITYE